MVHLQWVFYPGENFKALGISFREEEEAERGVFSREVYAVVKQRGANFTDWWGAITMEFIIKGLGAKLGLSFVLIKQTRRAFWRLRRISFEGFVLADQYLCLVTVNYLNLI